MTTCQAPHRLPDGYYGRLERMTPEAGAAATFIGEVLADDYACGDPAVGRVQLCGHAVPVCQYHHDFFQNYIAPLKIQNEVNPRC
jgi:hypothetical protein